ncbi:unnamed protein product, partial [Rotaria magnacalcarata]
LSSLNLEQQVRSILPSEVSSDELTEISRILSSIRILNDDDSELTASELSSLHSYRTDLSRACSLLTKHPQYDLRRYFLVEQSCRAYFTYLQLTNKSAAIHYGPPVIFETNLLNSPTVAWKRLIPQLFSHLNHPDSFVRDYLTNLLIRIAKDFPQLILYSVVVGITDDSKMRRIKSRDDNIYQRKSASTHESEDEKSENDIDEDDEEEDDIEKQENAVAMQNSFRLIYNVLSETNSHVVGQVKLFIHELRRVTFITFLEAVSQITRASAETPREQTFEKDYSKQIDAAIEQLKQPITLSNPHSCRLYSMLHRTGKRSGTIHSMNQISPKLAEIKHSVIPIPGEDGHV